MEKKGNKKRIIAIIAIVLLVIFLGVILVINANAEKRAQRKLTSLAKTFYSYYYEEQSDKDDKSKITVFLSKYADTGLTIKLKDMKVYLDNHKVENYNALSKCDEDKTKVTIYPFSPYGKKDRTIETKLECNFKKER